MMTGDPLEPQALTSDDLKIVRGQTLRLLWRDSGAWVVVWMLSTALFALINLGLSSFNILLVTLFVWILFELLVTLIPRISEYGREADMQVWGLVAGKAVKMGLYAIIFGLVALFFGGLNPTPEAVGIWNQILSENKLAFVFGQLSYLFVPVAIALCALSDSHGDMLYSYYGRGMDRLILLSRSRRRNRAVHSNNLYQMMGVFLVTMIVGPTIVSTHPLMTILFSFVIAGHLMYSSVRHYVLFKHIFEGGGRLYEPSRQTRMVEAT